MQNPIVAGWCVCVGERESVCEWWDRVGWKDTPAIMKGHENDSNGRYAIGEALNDIESTKATG